MDVPPPDSHPVLQAMLGDCVFALNLEMQLAASARQDFECFHLGDAELLLAWARQYPGLDHAATDHPAIAGTEACRDSEVAEPRGN